MGPQGPFIAANLAESPIPLTNGKGAFSDSLAEWVAAAVSHRASHVMGIFRLPVLHPSPVAGAHLKGRHVMVARNEFSFAMEPIV